MATREGYRWFRGAWRPSAAQARVLDEVAAGRTNAEIAARLGLSVETVKSHVARLLGATGCRDRQELAHWWQSRPAQPTRPPLLVPLFRLLPRAAATVAALGLGVTLLVAGLPALARFASPRTSGRLPVAFHQPTDPVSTPAPAATPAQHPGIVLSAQSLWTADGAPERLSGVRALAVDAAGNAYVQDAFNHRIVKFGPDGRVLARWGGEGEGPGQFEFIYPSGTMAAMAYPGGIAVAPDGTVYVADGGGRAQRFDASGRYLGEIGGRGRDPGLFEFVGGVAVDASGMLYVTDGLGGHRVQVFDATGHYVGEWGGPGNGAGQFNRPAEIVLDGHGHAYVAETRNGRIQKFRLP